MVPAPSRPIHYRRRKGERKGKPLFFLTEFGRLPEPADPNSVISTDSRSRRRSWKESTAGTSEEIIAARTGAKSKRVFRTFRTSKSLTGLGFPAFACLFPVSQKGGQSPFSSPTWINFLFGRLILALFACLYLTYPHPTFVALYPARSRTEA